MPAKRGQERVVDAGVAALGLRVSACGDATAFERSLHAASRCVLAAGLPGAAAASRQQLEAAQQELFDLRFRLATRQLVNHREIPRVKKKIARLKTIMRERELGIR